MSDFTQEALIDVARNDPDWNVRNNAVQAITDEYVLKDIFKSDSVVMVRINAMRGIGDLDFLQDECMNNPQGHVRMAILSHILDENLLEGDDLDILLRHIALNDPEDRISQLACRNLNKKHQDVFVNISKSKRDAKLRLEAISKITDENALSNLSLNDENKFIRLEAIQNPNMSDVHTLSEIIRDDEFEFNRFSAIVKIQDSDLFFEVVFDKSLYPRLTEIADNITLSAENYFFSILNDDDDLYRRIVAVNFIRDEKILENIVLNCDNDLIVAEAIKNTNFKNQEILHDLIKNRNNPDVVSRTIDKIDDEKLLIDYVNRHLSADGLTFKAISRITDFEFLAKLYDSEDSRIQFHAAKRMIALNYNLELIAADNPNKEIRLEAINTITDKYLLVKIASESEEVDIALAALDNVIANNLIEAYRPHRHAVKESVDEIVFKGRLWDLATENGNRQIRKSAISKLNEKWMLDEIISTEEDMELVEAAERRLDSLWQYIKRIEDENILNAIAQRGDDDVRYAVSAQIEDLKTWRNRIAKINEIDDVSRLKDIACNDYNYFVRCEAEGKLENILFNVRLDEVDLDVNQDMFKRIAEDETYPSEIRNKAISRLVK